MQIIKKIIEQIKQLIWCYQNQYLMTKNLRYFKGNGYSLEQAAHEADYPLWISKILWKRI